MRLLKANPDRRGLTLVEMLCVIAIITLLAALMLPGLARARDRARQTQCAGQLKQVGLAFHSFAHDHNSLFPMRVPAAAGGSMEYARAGAFSNSFAFRHLQSLRSELVTPRVLVCPADTRLPAPGFSVLTNENVSYFVSLNADYGKPGWLLAGDRNLTNDWLPAFPVQRLGPNHSLRWSHELHRFRGNLLFADAHVDQLADGGLAIVAAAITGGPQVLNLPAEVTTAPRTPTTASSPPPGGPAHSASPPGETNAHTGPPPEPASPTPRSDNAQLPPRDGLLRPPGTRAYSVRDGSVPAVGPRTGSMTATTETAAASISRSNGQVAQRAPAPGAGDPANAPRRSGWLGSLTGTGMTLLFSFWTALLLLGLAGLFLRARLARAAAARGRKHGSA